MKVYNILVLIFLFFVSNTNAIEISNFKSGLACTDAKSFGWICHETENIYITGQGYCIYNKKELPCTWHGFQFDYTNLSKDEKIKCRLKSSKKLNLGNPKEITNKDTDDITFELPIEAGNGHFYNPQYVALSYANTNHEEQTECYVGEKLLFEYKKIFIYPVQP